MISIRSLANFNGAPGRWGDWLAPPVTAQGPRSGSTRRTRGGDFYLATSGDLHLAINEDFPMAMDNPPLLDCILFVKSLTSTPGRSVGAP
jgi:hypothetical protein